VLSGAWICHASGIAASGWMRNLAAWAVGAAVAVVVAATYRPWALTVALLAAPIGLGAAFLAPGQRGIHRWLDLGPIHMNVAMTLLPAAAVGLGLQARDRFWPWLVAVGCLSLLALQTDASQTTAFGAVVVLIAAVAAPGATRYAMWSAAALSILIAWLRPDPLLPVPEVEQIVALGLAHAPLAAALAVLSLAALAAAPSLMPANTQTPERSAGWALSLLFALWALTPLLGAFPVPFVGVGMSPIVGGWLGVGLLAGALRKPSP
jgi:hypothetical protein